MPARETALSYTAVAVALLSFMLLGYFANAPSGGMDKLPCSPDSKVGLHIRGNSERHDGCLGS
jgi:hypothetical protein